MHSNAQAPSTSAPFTSTASGFDAAPDPADVLARVRRVAVLGASTKPERPGHYVPADLAAHGYDVVAVNPVLAGQTLFGAPAVASLADAGAVDVVDVFRRGEDLPAHLPELLAMQPRPAVVWLQKGVSHPGFVAALRAEGFAVVENRCMMEDRRTFGLSAPAQG